MKRMQRSVFSGSLFGVLAGVCWGISGSFSQYLYTATGMTSMWYVAVRMMVSGCVLLAAAAGTHPKELRNLVKTPGDFLQAVLSGIVGTMLFQFCFYKAVAVSNAGTATVFQYVCPVLVMLYACGTGRETTPGSPRRPGQRELFALFFALGGIFLICTHGKLHALAISKEAMFFGLFSAVFMTVSTVMPERLYGKYPTGCITGISLFSGGALAMLMVQPWRAHLTFTALSLSLLLIAILCGSILAYVIYAMSVKRIGSVKASLFSASELVTATLVSVVFLGSSFTGFDFLGCVAIAASVVLVSL